MSSGLALAVYHTLPPPLRAAAAGLRGWWLRRWRYDRTTERRVAEALERERWSSAEWTAWRHERLEFVLHRAATRVPAYREQWAARRRRGDRASWAYLENWPVLSKETLRRDARAFVADDCRRRAMYRERTSGTTGTPLELWYGRETVRDWYALVEARWRRWYGVSRWDRWAILGGQLVTPVRQRRPPFWVWNAPLRQLYLSSYHLAPDLAPYYLEALRRHRVRYLLGYTSALRALAWAALEHPGGELGLAVVVTNAEPLTQADRALLTRAFRCPVRETYGMSEIVTAAGECGGGTLHLWPEVGVLEVLADGRPAPAGAVGAFVGTGLLNADMPLIRYAVGDRGALAEASDPCACGRLLPALAAVEGRVDDVLVSKDGRRIGRLDPVFKAGLHLREAQIVQESLDELRVRLVAAAGFGPADERAIAEALRARLGDVRVRFERVDRIPRGPNGKFRAVVSRMNGAPGHRSAEAADEGGGR